MRGSSPGSEDGPVLLGVAPHGAELDDLEAVAELAEADLAVVDGPAVEQQHRGGGQQVQRQRDGEERAAHDDVEDAGEAVEQLPVYRAESGLMEERGGGELVHRQAAVQPRPDLRRRDHGNPGELERGELLRAGRRRGLVAGGEDHDVGTALVDGLGYGLGGHLRAVHRFPRGQRMRRQALTDPRDGLGSAHHEAREALPAVPQPPRAGQPQRHGQRDPRRRGDQAAGRGRTSTWAQGRSPGRWPCPTPCRRRPPAGRSRADGAAPGAGRARLTPPPQQRGHGRGDEPRVVE